MGPREWERARMLYEQTAATAGDLQQELGRLVIMWNFAENALRQVISVMCGTAPAIELVTAQMSAFALEDTLRAASRLSSYAPIAEWMIRCADEYKQLRDTRNQYVHGARLYKETGENLLLNIANKDVRAKLRILDINVTRYDIYLAGEAAGCLALWSTEISSWLLMARSGTPSVLPQMPALPPYRKVAHGLR